MTQTRSPSTTRRWCALAAFLLAASLRALPAVAFETDTLVFRPAAEDSLAFSFEEFHAPGASPPPRTPYGENLLTDPRAWRDQDRFGRLDLLGDYNRVDRLRLGVQWELQQPETNLPRVAGRIEYPFDRGRWLYGVQVEQPFGPGQQAAVGASMDRRTDHNELQQVPDFENSLALLFVRDDFRDYFEREGVGAYVAARIPHLTRASFHVRSDAYSSLPLNAGTRSWFNRDRPLRDNPAIDDGSAYTLQLRFERQSHADRHPHGVDHWIVIERGGMGLGGDFDYVRAFADFRSIVRLSPASTLLLRGVAGHGASGDLPAQREFLVGGVDGLRAHPMAAFRGNQMVLAQAEYIVGLWRLRSPYFDGGLHLIAFVDVGRAWDSPEHHWDVASQRIETDGGFGFGSSEETLRLTFAKNLREPDSDFVVSLRLQRPF